MEKENRIRAITKLYYSAPLVKNALLKFAEGREVVPSYMADSFGKRPDILQYSSDIDSFVRKGATSFHCSEELWKNPLDLTPELSLKELNNNRKGWDLLIDIDSQFFDYSKIALQLIMGELENYGIKNYGLKFSGSKGFHLIVSGGAFPKQLMGEKMNESFPYWPRTICEFLIHVIRPKYNKKVSESDINFRALEQRINLKKEDLKEVICPSCGKKGKKGVISKFVCEVCNNVVERKDAKPTKRRLRCVNDDCAGFLKLSEERNYFYCESCGKMSYDKFGEKRGSKVVYNKGSRDKEFLEGFEENVSGNALANLDLVLVANRHLFRMPYSLHEKTALSSIVLRKEEIESFTLKDANPLKIKIRDFMPENEENEGSKLLREALEWKKNQDDENKLIGEGRYKEMKFRDVHYEDVDENLFPKPIKKLLAGLEDGKKRGLFVLLTFLRCLNYPPERINKTVREWNEKNKPPLKEGYLRSQIEWHFRQNRKILPPNYSNDSFYRDIGILKEKPNTKNPLADVIKTLKKKY